MANKKTDVGAAVGVGVGVVAAAAAAAGAYWLYGSKHSAQHRRMAKSWMLKARAEVMDAVEKMQEIDKEAYMSIVNEVLENYRKTKGATATEITQMLKDFKSAWMHIQVAKNAGERGATRAKKTAKKAKRVVKKTVSKK